MAEEKGNASTQYSAVVSPVVYGCHSSKVSYNNSLLVLPMRNHILTAQANKGQALVELIFAHIMGKLLFIRTL